MRTTRAWCSGSGEADADFFDAVEAEATELAAEVRRACVEMADPEPLEIFAEVYAEPTPHVDRQRDGFSAYLDSFEEVQH